MAELLTSDERSQVRDLLLERVKPECRTCVYPRSFIGMCVRLVGDETKPHTFADALRMVSDEFDASACRGKVESYYGAEGKQCNFVPVGALVVSAEVSAQMYEATID